MVAWYTVTNAVATAYGAGNYRDKGFSASMPFESLLPKVTQVVTGFFFFFQAEDGRRVFHVTGVQTCALPISDRGVRVHLPGTTLRLRFPLPARSDNGSSPALGVGLEEENATVPHDATAPGA